MSKISILITLVLFLLLGTGSEIKAADRYSVATGTWSSAGTWSAASGGSPGAGAPGEGDNVYIEGGFDVTLDENTASLALLNISSGSTFFTLSGFTVTAVLITINGIYDNGSTGIISFTTMDINNGGTYRHSATSLNIPIATWNTGSTCEITGWTTANELTGSFNQSFYNFTWNCPNQTTDVSFAGFVSNVPGTFTLAQAGTNPQNYYYPFYVIYPDCSPTYGNYVQMSGMYRLTEEVEIPRNVTITNDFTLSGGEFYTSYTAPGIVDIGGDLNLYGGRYRISWGLVSSTTVAGNLKLDGGVLVLNAYSSTGTMTVKGNFLMSSGVIHMCYIEDGSAVGTLNVAGNFTHTGGIIDAKKIPESIGSIVFNGTGVQTYSSGGTVNDIINYTVNSGATLQMATPETAITGLGAFTLRANSTLGITSPDGITDGETGNIQVTGTRAFSTDANYIYNGLAAQNTGDGLPQTVKNLVFDNQTGPVTFSSAMTITNNFSVTSGSRANLGSLTHGTGTLSLGGITQPGGSYGHSDSEAAYEDDIYFDAATGIINNGFIEGTWLGRTNDWYTDSNWAGDIPNTETDVHIMSSTAFQPVISAGSVVAECRNLLIGSGASLTINSGDALTVANTLSNSGTLNLKSDASGISSLIIDNYTNNEGSGTEVIELYLSGGGTEVDYPWHYISSPVRNLATDVFTTGISPISNLAAYYENLAINSQYLGWFAFDGWDYQNEVDTGIEFDSLKLGEGYNCYSNELSVIKNIGGILQTESIVKQLSYSGTNINDDTKGWNLLGNPFSSTLDWDAISKPEFVNDAIYFTHNNSPVSYVAGVGVPLGTNGNIPPMQGFFVKTNQSGQSITLPASARIHSAQNRYKGIDDLISLIRLKVEGQDVSDETVIRLNEKANTAFDSELDAFKFNNSTTSISIWTVTGPENFSINSIPFPETETAVPIGVNIPASGTYKITANQLQEIGNYNVYLTDKETGLTFNLKTTPSISFSASKGSTGDRFIIKISNNNKIKQPSSPVQIFNIFDSGDCINIETLSDEWDGKFGSVYLIELTGRTVFGKDNYHFSKNSSIQVPKRDEKGMYIVRIKSGIYNFSGKVFLR